MNLNELIEVTSDQCPKCISWTYTLAHKIDADLCKELRVFGRELYPISVVDIFKIEEPEKFYVECIIGSKYLKVWFSKSLGPEIERRKSIIEDCLITWFSDKFNSDIGK